MTTALAIRDEEHYLATVSEVRALVERIEYIGDAKALADKARAAQVWGERAKLGAEQVNLAASARLWAERRAGELLIVSRENGERAVGGEILRDPESHVATLDDLGISKHESSRYQQLAEIPQPEFEQAIEQAIEQGKVSAAAVRRLAVPVSEELLAKQQRETLIQGVDRALRSMEFSASHARAEAKRVLDGGDPGPLLPSRFERAAEFAVAFANALRDGGIDG